MALTVVVIPGAQLGTNDKLTNSIFNLGAQPTIIINGTLSQLDDVDTTPGANGQPLVFVTATGKWTAGTIANLYIAAFTGASSITNGTLGGVPAPTAGQQGLFLRGDATWASPPSNIGNDLFMAATGY